MAKRELFGPKIDATTMTAIQELASAWIFKRSVQDNVKFTSPESIINDKTTYDELLNIWKGASKGKVKNNQQAELSISEGDWIDNFYKQNKKLLVEVSGTKFTVFTRGSTAGYMSDWYDQSDTFMDWISKYVSKEFKISKKDNWNPADVWLIKDEKKRRKELEDAMSGTITSKSDGVVSANLNQFNDIFREWFVKKQVMGISLKKVSGGEAKWKEVNVTNEFFKNIEAIEMKYKGSKCKFGPGVVTESQAERGKRKLKLPTKKGAFSLETQETMISLEDTANKKNYEIQIKANDNSKFDNLKYEPKEKSSSAARLGKATGSYVDDLVKFYGIKNWKRKWQDYPQNKSEFTEKEQNKYVGMIRELKADGVDIGDLTPEEAVINIRETFGQTNQPQTANSKLMQLTWLYNLLSLSTKNRNKLLTDIIYLAEKAGKRYGAYGKIY